MRHTYTYSETPTLMPSYCHRVHLVFMLYIWCVVYSNCSMKCSYASPKKSNVCMAMASKYSLIQLFDTEKAQFYLSTFVNSNALYKQSYPF